MLSFRSGRGPWDGQRLGEGGRAQTHARIPRMANGKRAHHSVVETRRANVTASLAAATKRHATPVRRGRGGRCRHRGPVGRHHVPAELHAGRTAGARADARTGVDAGAERTGAALARAAVPGPRVRRQRGADGRRYRRARVRAADHRGRDEQIFGHRVVRPVRGRRGATVAHVLRGQAPGVPGALRQLAAEQGRASQRRAGNAVRV